MRISRILFLSVFLFFGCWPINTDNPEKAFSYWAGFEPPKEFNVEFGEYAQSPHFTKEYDVFLKFYPTDDWWNKLVEQYQLTPETNSWNCPIESPDWFKPPQSAIRFWRNDEFDVSRYFYDKESGALFVFELQY